MPTLQVNIQRLRWTQVRALGVSGAHRSVEPSLNVVNTSQLHPATKFGSVAARNILASMKEFPWLNGPPNLYQGSILEQHNLMVRKQWNPKTSSSLDKKIINLKPD